jgi:hypothetical protein
MNFDGGFECGNCPRNADPALGRACPLWWEVAFTNTQSGEVKSDRACGATMLPKFLVEVIKASNRPAAEISKMSNAIVEGLESLERAQHGSAAAIPVANTRFIGLDAGLNAD